jgi:hypothetical protein
MKRVMLFASKVMAASSPMLRAIFDAEQSTAKIDDHHGAVERLA